MSSERLSNMAYGIGSVLDKWINIEFKREQASLDREHAESLVRMQQKFQGEQTDKTIKAQQAEGEADRGLQRERLTQDSKHQQRVTELAERRQNSADAQAIQDRYTGMMQRNVDRMIELNDMLNDPMKKGMYDEEGMAKINGELKALETANDRLRTDMVTKLAKVPGSGYELDQQDKALFDALGGTGTGNPKPGDPDPAATTTGGEDPKAKVESRAARRAKLMDSPAQATVDKTQEPYPGRQAADQIMAGQVDPNQIQNKTAAQPGQAPQAPTPPAWAQANTSQPGFNANKAVYDVTKDAVPIFRRFMEGMGQNGTQKRDLFQNQNDYWNE